MNCERWRVALFAMVPWVAGTLVFGQTFGEITFRYENPQLQPAKYVLEIRADGSGVFHSEPGAQPPPYSADYQPMPQALDREVQLSLATASQIFATAQQEKWFAIPCEDGKGKIAFQGTKMLSYSGPQGSGSCTYNWSKRPNIQKLTETFEAIAFTLEEGRRLEVEHKHDRLGLDAELEVLSSAVKDGRALEIDNIRPQLEAIIDDQAVLERARLRARKLLDSGKATASL